MLIPIAIAALIIYTFGFPLYVGYVWFRYKELIMEDQYLRAHELGYSRKTNPRFLTNPTPSFGRQVRWTYVRGSRLISCT